MLKEKFSFLEFAEKLGVYDLISLKTANNVYNQVFFIGIKQDEGTVCVRRSLIQDGKVVVGEPIYLGVTRILDAHPEDFDKLFPEIEVSDDLKKKNLNSEDQVFLGIERVGSKPKGKAKGNGLQDATETDAALSDIFTEKK